MSNLLRTKFLHNRSISNVNLQLRSLCSRFFSSIGDGETDNPPEPIPNRPLRNPKSTNFPKPDRPRGNFEDIRNSHKRVAENENEFLERFKLGFDQAGSGQKDNRNSLNRVGENDNAFLERFKLGFDQPGSVQNDKIDPEKKPENTEEEPVLQPPPEDADEIFKKMKETGLIPNAVAMLDGLCKDGLVQDAMKLFGLMRERGTIPEVVVYTAVVDGFCKAQKFDDAIRIFKKMQGNRVVPNAFSYGVLVRGLLKGKRLEDAHEFSVEMLEAGHSPNLATFVGLVDGYCREKGLEEAQKVIGSLKEKGLFFEERAVREYLDKKGPFLPLVWEAILGKKASKMTLF